MFLYLLASSLQLYKPHAAMVGECPNISLWVWIYISFGMLGHPSMKRRSTAKYPIGFRVVNFMDFEMVLDNLSGL